MSLSPAAAAQRLQDIDDDLADRLPSLETPAENWARKKRDKEHDWAVAFIAATGTVADRKAVADRDTSSIGAEEEAAAEAAKAVLKVLTTRASVGQTLLRWYTAAGA